MTAACCMQLNHAACYRLWVCKHREHPAMVCDCHSPVMSHYLPIQIANTWCLKFDCALPQLMESKILIVAMGAIGHLLPITHVKTCRQLIDERGL